MIHHVTCNTDDNYAQHCCAMLCSLFENNKDMTFHVHILTHDLSEENTNEINKLCQRYHCQHTIYEVDETKLEGVKFRKQRPLTKAAYYRILLPDILDDTIEHILYLDCDIIVLNDISDIFEVDLTGYALAACVDACPYNSHHRNQLGLSMTDHAFCSGVMMINLRYWREHHAVDRLLEFSKRDRDPVYLHDQDSLNHVFKNQWLVLPPKWNRGVMSFFAIHPNEKPFDYQEYSFDPKILHYASNIHKPWYNVNFPERGYYLKYLSLSGFPNPKFIPQTYSKKNAVYKSAVIYYVNKYIRPFVPDIVEIAIRDIFDISVMLVCLLINKKELKVKMLNKRIGKCKNGL